MDERVWSLLGQTDGLEAGLSLLINQCNEGNDELLQRYIDKFPDCCHILSLMDKCLSEFKNDSALLCFLCIERIVLLSASSSEGSVCQSVGHRLSLQLLASYLPCVYLSLSQEKPDVLSAAALVMLAAIVILSSSVAREMFNGFDFTLQHLHQLPSRLKEFKDGSDTVRTCYIKFLLSFFVIGDSSLVTRLLSQNKMFRGVFRYLVKDESETSQFFLSVVNKEVVMNRKISKTIKLEFFNKFVLEDISNVCIHHHGKDISGLAMELLLSLCTNNKVGISFVSKTFLENPDWTNNPHIFSLVTHLLPHIHSCAKLLIIQIIVNSPDLLFLFLKRASLNFDHKTNPNWQFTMEFINELFMNLPGISDLLRQCEMDCVNNTNMMHCIAYCVPHGLTRNTISVLLLSPDTVVTEVTLRLLLTVLQRIVDTQSVISKDKGFQLYFNDTILKQLPDVQTLIRTKQGIVQKEELESSQSGSDILCALVHVLYLYQTLSTTIMYRNNVNLSALFNDVYDSSLGSVSFPSIMEDMLSMLLQAPLESLKALVNAEILKKLINMMLDSDDNNKPIALLSRCCLVNPLLMDKQNDIVVLLDAACLHHKESGLLNVDRLSDTLIKYYRYDIFKKDCNCIKDKEIDLTNCSLEELLVMEEGCLPDIKTGFCDMCQETLFPLAECVVSSMDNMISDVEFQMYFMFVFKLAKQYNNTDEVVCSLMKRHPKLLSDKLCKYDITKTLNSHQEWPDFLRFVQTAIVQLDMSSTNFTSFVSCLIKELACCITIEGVAIREREEKLASVLISIMRSRKAEAMLELKPCLVKQWNKLLKRTLKSRFEYTLVSVLSELIPVVYESGCDELYSLQSVYTRVWSYLPTDKSISEIFACLEFQVVIVQLLVATASKLLSCGIQNKFQSIHYQFFLSSYNATTSWMDKGLLYLMYLYEQSGISMAQFHPVLWGTKGLKHYLSKREVSWLLWKQPTCHEIIDCFERDTMQQSLEHFPVNGTLDPLNPWKSSDFRTDSIIYDPCFVLPRLSLLLDSSAEVDCRKFISSLCFSYLIASTSALNEQVRHAGYHCLGRFDSHLRKTSLRGKRQLLMFMNVLRNSVYKKNTRLPGVVSAFFNLALPIITNQEHSLHSMVTSYLSKKSHLLLNHIPLYSTCLLSSSPQCILERQWMLSVLLRGLQCEADYYLYKSQDIFSDVMCIHHSPFTPKTNKGLILQLLLKAGSFSCAGRDLVWNQGLLPWLKDLHHNEENLEQVQNIADKIHETCNSKKCTLPKIPLYNEDYQFVLSKN